MAIKADGKAFSFTYNLIKSYTFSLRYDPSKIVGFGGLV